MRLVRPKVCGHRHLSRVSAVCICVPAVCARPAASTAVRRPIHCCQPHFPHLPSLHPLPAEFSPPPSPPSPPPNPSPTSSITSSIVITPIGSSCDRGTCCSAVRGCALNGFEETPTEPSLRNVVCDSSSPSARAVRCPTGEGLEEGGTKEIL